MAKAVEPFDEREREHLVAARRRVDFERATVIELMYENPFAKAGGLSAVGAHLPAAIAARGHRVVIISPLHEKVSGAPGACDLRLSARVAVWTRHRGVVDVRLFEITREGVRTVLLDADGFFDGEGSPYDGDLAADSVFFACALPPALAALGLTTDLVVHAHEWQMVPCALSCKMALLAGTLDSAVVVVSSHNPYDAPLPLSLKQRMTARSLPGHTFYQCFVPLMDGPVGTVSAAFAEAYRTEPLLTDCLADHLQGVFATKGIVGIDHGLFLSAEPAFCAEAESEARAGRPDTILAAKSARRDAMFDLLSSGELDGVGHIDRPADDVTPVFFTFGRLDFQKGFDVLAEAIRRVPAGAARFVIAAIPQRRPDPQLEVLKALGRERAGDVMFFGRRLARGYHMLMAGASFTVMPSLFEPWGAASEPFVQGTPVIARRTGGLATQVIDPEDDPERATGLLFREDRGLVDWRGLLHRPVGARGGHPLFDGMVDALCDAFDRATLLMRDRDRYGAMLARLDDKAKSFSWARAAEAYEVWWREAAAE